MRRALVSGNFFSTFKLRDFFLQEVYDRLQPGDVLLLPEQFPV